MKRFLFLATAAALLTVMACKKKDDNNTNNPTSTAGGTWTVGSKTFTATSSSFLSNTLTMMNGTNAIQFRFLSAPTTNSTYNVTEDLTPSNTNDVSVFVTEGTTTASYMVANTQNAKATVTVSGGKLSVSMPTIYVWDPSSSTPLDTFAATASVHQ